MHTMKMPDNMYLGRIKIASEDGLREYYPVVRVPISAGETLTPVFSYGDDKTLMIAVRKAQKYYPVRLVD